MKKIITFIGLLLIPYLALISQVNEESPIKNFEIKAKRFYEAFKYDSAAS